MTAKNIDLQRRLENDLKRLEARIDLAKARLGKHKADAEAEGDALLREVEAKRDRARAKLAELRDSGGEAWEEASRGASKAWQELQAAYNELERGLTRAADAVTA